MIEKWTSGQPGGLRTDVKGENAVVTPRVKCAANGNYTLVQILHSVKCEKHSKSQIHPSEKHYLTIWLCNSNLSGSPETNTAAVQVVCTVQQYQCETSTPISKSASTYT